MGRESGCRVESKNDNSPVAYSTRRAYRRHILHDWHIYPSIDRRFADEASLGVENKLHAAVPKNPTLLPFAGTDVWVCSTYQPHQELNGATLLLECCHFYETDARFLSSRMLRACGCTVLYARYEGRICLEMHSMNCETHVTTSFSLAVGCLKTDRKTNRGCHFALAVGEMTNIISIYRKRCLHSVRMAKLVQGGGKGHQEPLETSENCPNIYGTFAEERTF